MLCITTLYDDFSARSKCWWSLDKQSKEGDSLFLISSTSGYTQLINSATHIIGNSSSFIDLIFTQPPNLVTSSVVHASLHNNCHRQITFSHISFLIEYPPSYHRLIWDYSNANILNIRKSISSINWSHLFSDNHFDIQLSIFEEWWFYNLRVASCELRVVSCEFKKNKFTSSEFLFTS